jgi:hypothetical protein
MLDGRTTEYHSSEELNSFSGKNILNVPGIMAAVKPLCAASVNKSMLSSFIEFVLICFVFM